MNRTLATVQKVRSSLAGCVVPLVLALLAGGASGATRTWDGGGDGTNWFDPNNWDPNGAPASIDALLLNSGSASTASGVTTSGGGAVRIGGASVMISNTLTVAAGGTLALNGGQVTCATFSNSVGGTFNWTAGTLGFSGSLTITSSDPFGMGTPLTMTAPRTLDVTGLLTVGTSGALVINGGQVFAGSLHNTDGGSLDFTGGHLTIRCGEFVPGTSALTLDGPGNPTLTLTGMDMTATFSGNVVVGSSTGNSGTLAILNGADLSNKFGYVGFAPGSTGAVTVDGAGSTWTNGGFLYVGRAGGGTLDITNGGHVSNTATGYVGRYAGSTGTVTVDGAGSTWNNSAGLLVGYSGDGTLAITGGASVSSWYGYAGVFAGSTGTVTVDGAGSEWQNTADLYVGGSDTAAGGTGTLTVANGGLVDVAGTLKVWTNGTVDVSGGTVRAGGLEMAGGAFHLTSGTVEIDNDLSVNHTYGNGALVELFGSPITIPFAKGLGVTGAATLEEIVTLDGGMLSVGSLINPGQLQFLSGTLRLTGSNLAIGPGGLFGAALCLEQAQHMDVTGNVAVTTDGLLSGNGGRLSAGALEVLPGGEVSVGPGECLTIGGPATNSGGQMTLGGGTLHFEQTLTNTGGGLVEGNGMLRADGGMTNEATMAFSGVANVVGDVQNAAGALIIAAGGGPTTFFDDVVNDGDIRIGVGSMAAFLGSCSGGGGFPGPGTACFEGDLKPGSSPGIVAFGGNVVFGQGARLEMELAGSDNSNPLAPQYDCLVVAGNIALGGELDVMLLSGFTPKFGDEFTLIDGLALSGEFSSTSLPLLGSGPAPATPEPATLALLALGGLAMLRRRRR